MSDENLSFKRGDLEITVVSTKGEGGLYLVEVRAEGDKVQAEAFMKDIINGTAHLDLPIELSTGKANGPAEPLKVSKLMGDN